MNSAAEAFIRYALEIGAIKLLPDEQEKNDQIPPPYRFNFESFDSKKMPILATACIEAAAGIHSGGVDILFSAGYESIFLVVAMTTEVRNTYKIMLGCALNEKRANGKNELIGTFVKKGRKVLIVGNDMAMTSSFDESIALIRSNDGIPVGCVIAFDRQEKGTGNLSVVQEFEKKHNIPVRAAATLDDLISVIRERNFVSDRRALEKITAYKERYCV